MKIRIPVVGIDFWLFSGVKEWDKYIKEAKGLGFDNEDLGEMPEGNCGRCALAVVWVYSAKDEGTIYHEMSHLCDNIMAHMEAEKEKEFKAYILSWITKRSMKYYATVKGE